MRISDWSSDVCSSDLASGSGLFHSCRCREKSDGDGIMANPLDGIDLRHWWSITIVVGLAIFLGALAVADKATMILGLGALAIGIGEMVNHPKRMRGNAMVTITSWPRTPVIGGPVLDVAGAA